MYYFIYSFNRQRTFNSYRSNPPMTAHNKFDLDYLRKSIGNRFSINTQSNSIPICAFLKQYDLMELPKRYLMLCIENPADAMWAKLNAENLVKNVEKYGIVYHGSVGPVTDDLIKELTLYQQSANNEIMSLTSDIRAIQRQIDSIDKFSHNHNYRNIMKGCISFSTDKADNIDGLLDKYHTDLKSLSDLTMDIISQCASMQSEIRKEIEDRVSTKLEFMKSKIHISSM